MLLRIYLDGTWIICISLKNIFNDEIKRKYLIIVCDSINNNIIMMMNNKKKKEKMKMKQQNGVWN